MPTAFARPSAHALLAGAALLLLGTAHATLFQGNFDPATYAGTATFNVPPDCIPGAGFTGFTFPDDTCGSVDFVSGTVHDDLNTSTLTFGPQSDVASALRWLDGVLIGLDAGLIGPQTGISGDAFSNPPYFLQFNAGTEDLESLSRMDFSLLSGTPPTVQLLSCPDGPSTCTSFDGAADQFPYSVVGAVPEPGSLALIGGALLAGWIVRRRRSDA